GVLARRGIANSAGAAIGQDDSERAKLRLAQQRRARSVDKPGRELRPQGYASLALIYSSFCHGPPGYNYRVMWRPALSCRRNFSVSGTPLTHNLRASQCMPRTTLAVKNGYARSSLARVRSVNGRCSPLK